MARGEEQYEALVLHSTDIAIVFGPDGTILHVTPSVEAVSGYSASELVGTQAFDFVHPDDLAADLEDVIAAIRVGSSITREWRLCLADGTWAWYEFTLTDMSDEPAIQGIVGHFRDVSDRHLADAARQESEMLFHKTVELASDAIIGIGPDDRITAWNPSAAELFGWAAEEAIGEDVGELLVPPEERERYADSFRRSAEEVSQLLERPFEMVGMDKQGRRFPVEVSVVQFDLGGHSQLQALVRDIGLRKETEARLAGHGFTDPLTKLPNRVLLDDRLTLALRRMDRRTTKVSVMLLDIDDSAKLTAGLPPEANSELIVTFSRRLSAAIRASDTVARFADEEFVIVAEDLRDVEDAEVIAERVLLSVSEPLAIAGRELRPSASIGVAWASESTMPPSELLDEAFQAMVRAKTDGGGRHAVFAASGGAKAG